MRRFHFELGPAVVLSLGVGLVALPGCDNIAPKQPRFEIDTSSLSFQPYDSTEGVHPSRVILDNPNNVFAKARIDPSSASENKFDIAGLGPAARFYGWGTMLALQPSGEHQYFTARALHDIYDARLADPEDLPFVRRLAIDAYQAVLDEFGGFARTFDASGTVVINQWETAACLSIIELGERILGDWVLVDKPGGFEEGTGADVECVRINGGDGPNPDGRAEPPSEEDDE